MDTQFSCAQQVKERNWTKKTSLSVSCDSIKRLFLNLKTQKKVFSIEYIFTMKTDAYAFLLFVWKRYFSSTDIIIGD